MGHKVNPQIFRLGISVDWKHQLRDPLLANIFIYKMVKNLVFQYSVPYISYSVRRSVSEKDMDALRSVNVPKSADELTSEDIHDLFVKKRKVISNPFLENSFVFSHLNISYAPSLFLAIFLLDGNAEKERLKKNLPENSFYYLTGKFYNKYRRHSLYFLKNMFLRPKNITGDNASAFFHYFFLRNILRHRFKTKRNRKRKLIFYKRLLPAYTQYPVFLKLRRKYRKVRKVFPIWLVNSFKVFYKPAFSSNILQNLKILKFLIRYIKFYNKNFSKKRLFFFNILIVSISSLLTLLPKNKISRRLFVFLTLCYMYLFSFRYLHFQYNKEIFQSRFFLFNFLSKFVLFSLKKVAFLPTDKKLILRYYGLHNRNVNSHFILNYIIVKLSQYFILNDILRPLIRRLKSLSYIKGFRLIISGRLTRKERAAFIVKSFKTMPLSSYKQKIDYAADFKIMKFGVVGIKIYLLCDGTPPYYYFFEFKNKL